MLYQVCRELIPRDSPVASIGDEELQFFHTFFEHIDTERAFCGLRPVSDGNAVLWTSSKGSKILQSEAEKELDTESMYKILEANNTDPTIMEELAQKDKKIHELESVLNALEEELGNGNNEGTKVIPRDDVVIQEQHMVIQEQHMVIQEQHIVEDTLGEENNAYNSADDSADDSTEEEEAYESRIDEGMGVLHHEFNNPSRDGVAMSEDAGADFQTSAYDQTTFSGEGFAMTTDSEESSGSEYSSESDDDESEGEEIINRKPIHTLSNSNRVDDEAEYQVE